MRIAFNISNYTKCLCPVCRVQAKSECIKAKEDGWRAFRNVVGKILEAYPESPETYELEAADLKEHEIGKRQGFDVPEAQVSKELYCSTGKSDCPDLDTDKRCLCPDCLVWETAGLTKRFFCMTGSAQEMEAGSEMDAGQEMEAARTERK